MAGHKRKMVRMSASNEALHINEHSGSWAVGPIGPWWAPLALVTVWVAMRRAMRGHSAETALCGRKWPMQLLKGVWSNRPFPSSRASGTLGGCWGGGDHRVT